MVVDPAVLIDELDMLESKGVSTARVKLSGNAHLIMPYHQELDRVTERFPDDREAVERDVRRGVPFGSVGRTGEVSGRSPRPFGQLRS